MSALHSFSATKDLDDGIHVKEHQVATLENRGQRNVILVFCLGGTRPHALPGDFWESKRFLPRIGDRFSRTASFLWSQLTLGVLFEGLDELRRSQRTPRVAAHGMRRVPVRCVAPS